MNRRHPPAPVPAGRSLAPATDLALVSLLAVVGFGCLLWAGAAAACLVTGRAVPDGAPGHALAALTRLHDPASAWPRPAELPGPVAYWTTTASTVLAVGCVITGVLRSCSKRRGGTHPGAVRSLPGLASVRKVTRPGLHDRRSRLEPAQVGYLIGRVHGRELWCSVEDSALLVGPPRMGKGLHLVIPWILDAPGPVVATSTRPDTLAVAYHGRADCGPVGIFDPQRLAGLPGGLRWSPVRGCETPRTALVRARGLAAGVGFGRTVTDSDFWTGQTETALRCLLHAAALDGRGPVHLYRWSLNPALAEDAVTILTRHASAAPGWADALDAAVHADPRTRDSIWLGVRQSLAALADPDVLDSVNPGDGEQFHPESFLHDSGTLFLLAAAVTSASCAPLVAAFVEDITETARAVAARAPGARLDPPLLLALDEIANLTPLPSLPSLMAEGGGSGITTLAVLQSLAQARNRWGEHAADTIWDAATVKVVLGGLAKLRDLEDVARLLGEVDQPIQTISQGRSGDRSSSVSLRQVPVMPPAMLRTLPFGAAVLLLRHTGPIVIDLQPWPARADANRLHANRAHVEAAVANTATSRIAALRNSNTVHSNSDPMITAVPSSICSTGPPCGPANQVNCRNRRAAPATVVPAVSAIAAQISSHARNASWVNTIASALPSNDLATPVTARTKPPGSRRTTEPITCSTNRATTTGSVTAASTARFR